MEELLELEAWDFPDTHMEPDGYDMKSVVDFTARNFQVLIDEHNKLVRAIKSISL